MMTQRKPINLRRTHGDLAIYDRLPKVVRARIRECHFSFPEEALRGLRRAADMLRVVELIDNASRTGDNMTKPNGIAAIAALKEAGL